MRAGEWYVFRSTTDKLAEHLNHIVESGDTVVAPAYTGDRFWVIVCIKGRDYLPAVEQASALRDAFPSPNLGDARAAQRGAR